jgi:hypothetical protein
LLVVQPVPLANLWEKGVCNYYLDFNSIREAAIII